MEGVISISSASKTVVEAVVETRGEDVSLRACKNGPSIVQNLVVDDAGEEETGASKEEFFFPIMQPWHCYVICFNLMYQQWEILDVSTSTLKVAEKCGEMTSIVRDMFVHYMIVIGVGNKVKVLEKAKVKKVVMN
ncbi:unnamed protein product [Cuscuta europaea]|uniref:Uncharacterized protein n=1 Tax=Cuscuta europaea TaxID=41803 RepID=A0A9P0YJX7_CUSEU|nr:unnamed protein product [Cuscuta europaea]